MPQWPLRGTIEVVGAVHLQRLQLQPQRWGRALHFSQHECERWIRGISEDGHPSDPGHGLLQQL
jgi:hypothetical protein